MYRHLIDKVLISILAENTYIWLTHVNQQKQLIFYTRKISCDLSNSEFYGKYL